MKSVSKTLIFLGVIIAALFSSCEKEKESDTNKNIDKYLIGIWEATYSTVDRDMGITVFTDMLTFNVDNSGKRDIYKFKDLDFSDPFTWHTESNLLYIKYDSNEEKLLNWNYIIRNDSLFISGNPTYTSK